MQEPTFSLDGGALGDAVGISWLIKDIDSVRIVGHGGTTNGQLSAFEFAPGRNFAITVLTNSSKGGELHMAIVKWALEAYLGVTEVEPEVLRLDQDALREYTGEYRSDVSIVTITAADGGSLHLHIGYTDEGLELYKTISEDPPEEQELTIWLTADDHYTVVEGQYKGIKGNFVRRDGRIRGINLGGRLAEKR